METAIQGEITATYVRHGQGKYGKWVQLSDGVQPQFFQLDETVDIEHHQLEYGQSITVQVVKDAFKRNQTITDIVI